MDLPSTYQPIQSLNDSVIYAYGLGKKSFIVLVSDIRNGVVYGQVHSTGKAIELGMQGQGTYWDTRKDVNTQISNLSTITF